MSRCRTHPETETARAREAWHDYYALGVNRTHGRLIAIYLERQRAGTPVPTTSLRQMQAWSGTFHWQQRVLEENEKIAAAAADKLVADRQQFAVLRLGEARQMHTTGAMLLQKVLERIQAGDLNGIPLLGYWTTMEFQTETVEQDYVPCAVCQDKPNPACPMCQGSMRQYTGKGRRRLQAGSKVLRVDGMMDLAPTIIRLIEVGQRLERTELGEGQDKTQELVDAILDALPDPLRAEVSAGIAASLAAGNPGRDRRAEPVGAPRAPAPPPEPVGRR